MKILSLRKKIIINFSITGALLLLLGFSIFFNSYKKNSLIEKTEKISREATEIQAKTVNLEKKTIEFKEYVNLWFKLNDNKKSVSGIKIDDVNKTLEDVASKYSIKSPIIKIALPEDLKDDLFNRSTVIVSLAVVNLSFKSFDDVKALSFIDEFFKSLPGYQVINNLEIKKEKEYTLEDLVSISKGEKEGNISVKIDFFWYTFKDKNPDKSQNKAPENKKSEDKKIEDNKVNQTNSDEKKPIQ